MIRDIQFGLKLLWKDRGYAATAILTLGICLGVNAAVFTIVHSVLLKPLPVPDSARIVLMSNQYPKAEGRTGLSISSSVPDYYDRLRDMTVFEDQAMYTSTTLIVNVNDAPELVDGLQGTPSLFRLLKVSPVLGRIFDESEGQSDNDLKVILSYGLWQQLYGGKNDIIGKQLRMGARFRTIVGVMPPDFQFGGSGRRFYVPLTFSDQQKSDDSRHSNGWTNIGRLKPVATIEQAQQQVNALNAANLELFPEYKSFLNGAGFYTRVDRLQDVMVRSVRNTLYLLWGGAAFVLLIGTVNITNLTLARCNGRMKELSTRLAIGASRPQVARQLMFEGLLLTLAGALGGILTAFGMLRAVETIGLNQLPRANEIQIDFTVIGATLAVAVAIGALIGLVALAHLFKVNLTTVLVEDGRTVTSGRKAKTVRRVLVVAQVGFAFILLLGSVLLVASFRNLLAVDPGFKPNGVITAGVYMGSVNYPNDSAVRSFTSRLLDSIRNIPGVLHAGGTTTLPFSGRSNNVIVPEGYRMRNGESAVSPYRITITPGYLEAMGVPLLRGRLFDEHDSETGPAVIIIDEELAQKFWPGADPIGKRAYVPDTPQDLTGPNDHTKWLTVVGVVGTIRLEDLAQRSTAGAYYFPTAQDVQRGFSLAIKTTGDPTDTIRALRARIKELDRTMLLSFVRTMDEYTALSLNQRRTTMLLATGFAIVSLFLSAIGIYGVLSFLVTQRFREIGIRIALGSPSLGIFALVLREGALLVAGGLVVGLIGTAWLDQVLQNQIYGLRTLDSVVTAIVITILGTIALAACWLPARRAMRVDPVTVLNRQ